MFSLSLFILNPAASYAKTKTPSVAKVSSEILKLDPSLKVLAVYSTPMPDLWEIVVEVRTKQKTIVYLNLEKGLLFSGTLFDINKKVNLTKARQDEINRVDFASISRVGDLVLGNPSAKKKVIVFDDPD
jgi:thiol:disulfide interchange protein DsbC